MADVSGKGVAAAMLSSNLRAVFRSLIPMGLSTDELMSRANRFSARARCPRNMRPWSAARRRSTARSRSSMPGILPVLLASASGITVFESTSQPLGIFDDQKFTTAKQSLRAGDTLVLYTDGISEAEDDGGGEYGIERLRQVVEEHCSGCAENLIDACRRHLEQFRGSRERFDDETLLAIQYAPAMGQVSTAVV